MGEDLHDAVGETALGAVRSALHEEDDLVVVDYLANGTLHLSHLLLVGGCRGLLHRLELRRHEHTVV